MSHIQCKKFATIKPHNDLKFKDIHFVDLLSLTSDYDRIYFDTVGMLESLSLTPSLCCVDISADYLSATVRNNSGVCFIKIDNSTPITHHQIIIAETLAKLIYYQRQSSKISAIKKQIFNKLNLICKNPNQFKELAYALNQLALETKKLNEQTILIKQNCELEIINEALNKEEFSELIKEYENLSMTSQDKSDNFVMTPNGIIFSNNEEQETK